MRCKTGEAVGYDSKESLIAFQPRFRGDIHEPYAIAVFCRHAARSHFNCRDRVRIEVIRESNVQLIIDRNAIDDISDLAVRAPEMESPVLVCYKTGRREQDLFDPP